MPKQRKFNAPYTGENLNRVAFPMGGIGAGMVCLEGTGSLSHLSLRNKPDIFNEAYAYSALCIKGAANLARVLEGPVPAFKAFGQPLAGNGLRNRTYGLPRFASATFKTRFPFGVITLRDPLIPLRVEITGWSPFIPGDADNSSLPVAALEYRFKNASSKGVDAVYSFNSKNLMAIENEGNYVAAAENGFILRQDAIKDAPWQRGDFCVTTDAETVAVNCAWFRGGWSDPQAIAWRDVEAGELISRPPVTEGMVSTGASLFVPLRLAPGEEQSVRLMLSWYVPESDQAYGKEPVPASCGSGDCSCNQPARKEPPRYRPWYAGAFPDIQSVARYWRENYDKLRKKSVRFSRCFYDTTLPPEVVEAVSANLTILKSPTCLRQADGRFWGWEGCGDNTGCCAGSCTHVWNYAQAMPHLFPALERSMRETEFFDSQDERGHQFFRASLPIRPVLHDFHAAADGQLGGIMKVHRDWRISGDTQWLRKMWPRVKESLNYCIETWDPDHLGLVREPHHNTYDIEFWGPDGMCTSFYLGALVAALAIGRALGEEVQLYADLSRRGREAMEKELFDGEYFFQKVEWEGLRAGDPTKLQVVNATGRYSPEAVQLLQKEGPKYQYGRGCLADGVLGAMIAAACGVGEFLDHDKVTSHLRAVHKYNLRQDLTAHVDTQRPTYAFGKDGGLLLCTWPKGGRLSLPFPYSDEVWTGIEYQVAAHLMMHGLVQEGLDIVRLCRARYDGRIRNPFNEYECGHWYARAMASYAMLQGLTGARYDAVEKRLILKPSIPGDFRAFLSTATGYGTVGVREGKPFVEVRQGKIEIARIDYVPCGG